MKYHSVFLYLHRRDIPSIFLSIYLSLSILRYVANYVKHIGDMHLKNKLRGLFYGMAIGDALGKGTEFMTKREVGAYYPDGLRQYTQIINDFHRSQWKQGEWTNDTELILRISDIIVAQKGFDLKAIAQMMRDWLQEGPVDVVSHMRWVIQSEGWLEDPLAVAENAKEKFNLFDPTNEALLRSILTGIFSDDIEKDTSDVTRITHNDPRCVSSAQIIAAASHALFWQDRLPEYEQLEELCLRYDRRTIPYLKSAHEGHLEHLELDDETQLWHTHKSLGAALWALWHCTDPAEALFKIVDEGGDANTNASLALALLGIRYGADALPQYLVKQLENADRIEETADKLHTYLKTR